MLHVGDTTIVDIEESVQPSFVPQHLLPECTQEAIDEHLPWMTPRHYDVAAGKFRTSVRSYLVKTPRHTVLIDCCGGNHKNRPYFPRFHQRDHDWLARLSAAGVSPEQVDFVMCTHLHADHVGWNTVLGDGRWRPTFPNAKYIAHRDELARWNPSSAQHVASAQNKFTWEDSILPVIQAGQSLAVDDGYTLDDTFTVEPSPGHTLSHVSIRLRSKDQHALFSGDVMHVPLQIYYPRWGTSLDDDPQLGVRTRLALLESCAEQRTLLLPTHFVPGTGCTIERRRDGFAVNWNEDNH
ncbi:MBL fold metallo-hydrolase [Rhodopseudomonas palustris]|uniref:MBL fold metallo-hydrolase n=1 Tax=Rhodopseudomonas palustris TaxID=1076 RepID=A0A418V0K8_RHOPL|nr:MBL fold metallo-hydrolase [Rhodopseudomonas palustris]RJF69358.1 MBL fold metallo-hydrolase [Rhodopseudomonas palustris]